MSALDVNANAKLQHSCNWKCCFRCACWNKGNVSVVPESPNLREQAQKVEKSINEIRTATNSPLPFHHSMASFEDHEFKIVVIHDN